MSDSDVARDVSAGVTNTLRSVRRRAAVLAFLKEIRRGGSVSLACQCAGISRDTAYEWRKQHRTFDEAWNEITNAHTDAVEVTAMQMASGKVTKGIYYLGKEIAREPRYFPNLTMWVLERRKPNRWAPASEQLVRRKLRASDKRPLTEEERLVELVKKGALQFAPMLPEGVRQRLFQTAERMGLSPDPASTPPDSGVG